MEVTLTPDLSNDELMVLHILWNGKVMHKAALARQRASRVADLWAEAGYPVTWLPHDRLLAALRQQSFLRKTKTWAEALYDNWNPTFGIIPVFFDETLPLHPHI